MSEVEIITSPYEEREVEPTGISQIEAVKAIAFTLLVLTFVAILLGFITWLAWLIYQDQPVLAVAVFIAELIPLGVMISLANQFIRRPLAILEIVAGIDINQDGVIGPLPPGYNPDLDLQTRPREQAVPRVQLVPVHNWRQQEPTPPTPEPEQPQPASAAWLTNFELDAADLAAFISQAGQIGLSRSAWLTQPRKRLPSGRQVTRSVYDRVTAEMAALGWAERTPAGWQLTQPVRTILQQLEELVWH